MQQVGLARVSSVCLSVGYSRLPSHKAFVVYSAALFKALSGSASRNMSAHA